MTDHDLIDLYEYFWQAKANGGYVKIEVGNAMVIAQIAEISQVFNSQDKFIKLHPVDHEGIPVPIKSFLLSDIAKIEKVSLLKLKMKKSAKITINTRPLKS